MWQTLGRQTIWEMHEAMRANSDNEIKSRRSFKPENWMTNNFLSNHGLNGISLHSVGFEFFKKELLVALGIWLSI